MKLVLLFLAWVFCLANAQPVQERLELVEDDILMTKEQKNYYKEVQGGRVRRAALKEHWLWPKGEVFYTFKDNLDAAGRSLARNAMKHWKDRTCLKFTRRTNQPVYVEFQYKKGCRAQLGYDSRSPRLISIGSNSADRCTLGSTIHEIGHAIGFYHEHVRPDRDQYVTINKANMRPGDDVARNFEKVSTYYVDSRGQEYDYGSIMHYSRYQGNNRYNAVVIQPKQPNIEIGQRDGLSAGDIEQTKIMYKCNDRTGESELDYVPSDHDEEEQNGGSKQGPKPGEIQD